MRKIWLYTIAALFIVGQVSGQQGCKWEDPNTKELYDLSKLTNNQNDYIFNYDPTDPEKKMFLNMCRATITTVCGNGVGICQQWDPKNTGGQASLGQASTLTFTWGDQKSTQKKGLIAHYAGGDLSRRSEIDFTCAKGAGLGTPAYWDEVDLVYYFTWPTAHACPIGKEGGGLSGGSILLIIVLVCAVVYLVGGILFRKFRLHAEGIDVIPNLNFWTSLPGLVKDGFVWTFRKITGKGGSGSAYTTVA